MFLEFISKTDIFDAIIISSDVLTYCEKRSDKFFLEIMKRNQYIL